VLRSAARHGWVLLWVNLGQWLDPLRSQPRFVDLLQRLKLPARSAIPRVGGIVSTRPESLLDSLCYTPLRTAAPFLVPNFS
jgi:hypothetical protein